MYEGTCIYFDYVVNIVHDVAVNVFLMIFIQYVSQF